MLFLVPFSVPLRLVEVRHYSRPEFREPSSQAITPIAGAKCCQAQNIQRFTSARASGSCLHLCLV